MPTHSVTIIREPIQFAAICETGTRTDYFGFIAVIVGKEML
jgi:hypothetical protein